MIYDFDGERRRDYKQFIPIESLVTSQINRIMEYRSKKIWESFEESVDALIDLLAPDDEETVFKYKEENQIRYDISRNGIDKYRGLFRFIKRQLYDKNIVWKRGTGYEIGHD